MLDVNEKFRKTIHVKYPPNNNIIFEEWFYENWSDLDRFITDREIVPIFFTSWWVNNNYGNDIKAFNEVQEAVDGLDRGKKWFCVVQYDDGCLVDFKDLDIIIFGMAQRDPVKQRVDYIIPLFGQPNPFVFNSEKKYCANFVGAITHPIRTKVLNAVKGKEFFYVETSYHQPEKYLEIISQSLFTLCPRGYSATSFRITEALEYGSVPVYISDTFMEPHGLDFNTYGVLIPESDIDNIETILKEMEPLEIIKKQDKGREVYVNYYTYEGNLKLILEKLETEYNTRQSLRKAAEAV